ncbi:hypothetical protein CRYUN_Cryun13aG0013400 [Craigia yunnanensis]
MDLKLRDEEARRQRGLASKVNAVDGARRIKVRERASWAVPAPEANAEIQANLDVSGRLFYPSNLLSISSIFNSKSSGSAKSSGPGGGPSRRRKTNKNPQRAPSRKFIRSFKPSSIGLSMDMLFRGKSEAFRSQN